MKYKDLEIGKEDIEAAWNIIKESYLRIKVPKNQKNKIGVVFAIKTEKSEDKIKLESDFINELNRYLKESGEGEKFYIFKFPDSLTNQIADKIKAKELLIRSRSHFLIYGDIVQRKIKGSLNYIFRLHGMVRHKTIPYLIQQNFQKEFSELFLPQKFTFSESDETLGFELSSQWVGYVVKYVIGMAAFHSGDTILAEKLYNDLECEIKNINKGDRGDVIPVIYEIERRLPSRLSEVYTVYINMYYDAYAHTRNKDFIFACSSFLDRMSTVDPENYSAHLIRAILYFFKNEIDMAIDEIENLTLMPDNTWRYSLGFLYAFKGDIPKALENYKKTFYKPTASNVCLDSEIFISDVINENPKMTQLYFFRGLLNYKIKRDYTLAYNDFQYFINHNGSPISPELSILANKYIFEIENNLGI